MPALGFGTLIPDPAVTTTATRDALEAGFRHFDCAERYGNEREVGRALQAGPAAGGIAREEIFVTTKLWNSNHRPERVQPAFEASLDRLRLRLCGSSSHIRFSATNNFHTLNARNMAAMSRTRFIIHSPELGDVRSIG